MRDAVSLLNQAVEIVREMGYGCEGWTLQSSPEGYIAWLYRIEEQHQLSLMEDVEIHPTAEEAALWCLEVVQSAQAGGDDEEE